MKLWLLTNTPSSYQMEFFRAIHRDGRIALDVRFMRAVHRKADPVAETEIGFPCRIMRAVGPESWRDEFRLHPTALKECLRGGHDFYILSGHYTSITFLFCALFLSLRRRPWAMWLEQPWPADYRPPWATRTSSRIPGARTVRRVVLSTLLRMCRGVLCIGTAAVEAYQALGASAHKLHFLPYFCDTSRFEHPDAAAVAARRTQLSLSGGPVFIFSGALIPRKGVDVLLSAFAEVTRRFPSAELVILGNGPLHEALAAGVDTSIRHRVHFAGQVPQEDLPAYFGAASVFVFPSRHDGWAVVINEACGAGLPIVATRSTGAVRDLVTDGFNGFVVDRDDAGKLAAGMMHFLDCPEDIRRFGDRSREVGRRYALQAGVDLLTAAIDKILASATQ